MHRFRHMLPAVLIALLVAIPASAPADDPEPVTSARIGGLRNSDGTYVDGVAIELSAALEASDAIPRPPITTEYSVDGGPWSADTRAWLSGEGTHTVTYRSRYDALYPRVEIVERARSLTLALRSPRPVTTVSVAEGLESEGGAFVGGVDLALKASLDWPDGAARPSLTTEYRLDDGPWVAGTSVRVSSKGTHRLSYRSRYYPSWAPVEVVEEAGSTTVTVGSPLPVSSAAVLGNGFGDGTYVGPVYVGIVSSLDWPDESAPSLTTEYSLDGGRTWTPGMGVDVTADGVTTLLYRAFYVWWNIDGRIVEPAREIRVSVHNPLAVTRASTSGREGANGWHTSPVTVRLDAEVSDGSDPARTDYTLDGSTWSRYAGPFVVANDGTTTVTFRSTSIFGGVEPARSLVVRIDTAPPTLEPVTPSQDVGVVLGADVRTRWHATETVSGLSKEWGSLIEGSPLDTSSVGRKTVVFGASDMAGNESWAAVDYRVEYDWGGFVPAGGGDSPIVCDAGAVVPVAFAVRDADGDPVATAHAALATVKLDDAAVESAWAPVFAGASHTGGEFRYDPATRVYRCGLDTGAMGPGTYRVVVTLDDGTSHDAVLAVRQ